MHSRKLFAPLLLLVLVVCAIYFVASGDNKSLGSARPVRLQKDSMAKSEQVGLDFDAPREDPSLGKPAEKMKEIKEQAPIAENQNVQKPGDAQPEPQVVGDFTETPFMQKMANETLKAKLGNSAWHLLHTILARYPDKPSLQEKNTLRLYVELFAQVYPCGDCARHFQQLLKKHPVQVSSRKTAALWGCFVHNKVNQRLNKPDYDCTKILEDYDCGCGQDEKEPDATLGGETMDHLRQIKIDEKGQKERGG